MKKNKKNQKKENILIRIFFSIFLIIFVYLFINIIFNNKNTIPHCSFLELILSSMIYCTFLFFIYKVLNKKITNKAVKIILLVLFFIIQCVFGYYFAVEPSWDFGAVHNAAIQHVNNQMKIYNNMYFYRYSNNLGLAVLLMIYYKIFSIVGITNYTALGIGLNIIMIDLSLLFMYKIIKKYISNDYINYFMIISLIFTPFITYVPIFYTDTISMPFTVGGLYFFLEAINTIDDEKKQRVKKLLLSGFLFGIGGTIKITVLIIYIAIFVFGLITINKERLKRIIVNFLIMTISLVIPLITLSCYKTITFNHNDLNTNSFPYTHWIMMGMYDLGGYHHEDVEYTLQYNTTEEKKKANIKIIKNRFVEKVKKHTLISSYTDKTVFVFGDGTFFAPEKLRREEVHKATVKDYILKNPKNRFYMNLAQVEWIVCFAFIIIGVIFKNYLDDNQKTIQLIICITMFGLLLFFILWEARSRYLVNMIPMMLLCGFIGMQSIINRKAKKNKKRK